MPALLVMFSLPATIVACFTVIGANAARRGKKLEPADMAPFMPWFTLTGFALSSGLGIALARSQGLSEAVRWEMSPLHGLVGAVVGAVGACIWHNGYRRLAAAEGQSKDQSKRNPALEVSYPLLMLMGLCAGPAEEWVFRGTALASLDRARRSRGGDRDLADYDHPRAVGLLWGCNPRALRSEAVS